jgi:hypothetical protein
LLRAYGADMVFGIPAADRAVDLLSGAPEAARTAIPPLATEEREPG